MREVKKLVIQLDDEIKGALRYAEKYLECKAEGNMERTEMYFPMAQDELRHAMNIHAMIEEEIEKIKKVYTPPADMIEKWTKEHEKYIDRVSRIKSMLSN